MQVTTTWYMRAGQALSQVCAACVGIGGYSTSTVALLFVGALTVVLATAPRAAEDPYTTPAGERPLPWEYDYEDVASYWAQRWAPACSGRQTHAHAVVVASSEAIMWRLDSPGEVPSRAEPKVACRALPAVGPA